MALLALWRGASSNEELLRGRPQRFWFQTVDNFEGYFVPKLPRKHHEKVPMQAEIRAAQRQRFRDVERGLRHKRQRNPGPWLFASHDLFLKHEGKRGLPNPYEEEIRTLRMKPPPSKLLPPPEPPNLEETSVVLISSLADLQALIDDIDNQSCTTVAVEVKQSQQSYRGFTVALLLSSEKQDYVIDPYRIYPHLYRLNAVTANPRIQKIFFDAPDQILNLQRDFSVYVVNCFDVAVGQRVLSPGKAVSLSSLIWAFVNRRVQQREEAEWLARPFEPSFLNSVREEIHFLPFIAQCIYNRLAASSSSEDPCSLETAKNPNGCLAKSVGFQNPKC